MTHYFTGKPCPNGHIAQRFTSAYTCVDCAQMHKRGYRADPDFHARELAYKAEYRDANRDAINEYARRYWRENPKAKISDAICRKKHRKKRNENSKKYYANNPNAAKLKHQKWRAKNPDAVRAYISARRARKMKADGRYNSNDIKLIFSEQSGQCPGCLCTLEKGYHVDHITPLILGGSNWPNNLQLLCPSCNSRKGAMHPTEWFSIINKAYLA